MDVETKMIIATMYAHKEGGAIVDPWFTSLRNMGLMPRFVVMDGEQTVMKAIRAVWPHAKVQRCLYHIQREGMRWLRTYPKTAAGRDLRALLGTLCDIKTIKERNRFIKSYRAWLDKYRDIVKSLPSGNIAFKDLKRTIVLLNNALPDMFQYLKEPIIPGTTNALESFYSRLKADYRRHRGLTQKHKIHYLKWYCNLKK
jgi:transposase-like protein